MCTTSKSNKFTGKSRNYLIVCAWFSGAGMTHGHQTPLSFLIEGCGYLAHNTILCACTVKGRVYFRGPGGAFAPTLGIDSPLDN